MPNWVYNSITNYSNDLYEKYRSENQDIDFNKIIPEPEEITNTVSGSVEIDAKKLYKFKKYKDTIPEEDLEYKLRHDHTNPLRSTIENIASDTAESIGYLCIENPDKSLNKLLKDKKNNYEKFSYERYIAIFGNKSYNKCDIKDVYNKYRNKANNNFKQYRANNDIYPKYDSIESYGAHLEELKEKYGYDNWYSWRNANWGTKWNACRAEYDKNEEHITFDTAWDIPYPIIAKIAQDNPEAKLDGVGEEETGWRDYYKTENGNVIITTTGQDNEEEELESPITFNYDKIKFKPDCMIHYF